MNDPTTNPNLQALSRQGVAVWLDDLSRERVETGNLAGLTKQYSVVGVTSNPTIFESAVSAGDWYDDTIAASAAKGYDADQAVRVLTTDDVRSACDVLAPLVEQTGGLDGRVSIEVDPRLAHDTEATIEQAKQLWDIIGRSNLYIKIPATKAGLPAITETIAAGISVNVTLVFSVQRYREVLDAHQAGLEQRLAAGESLDGIASVGSFFVSRMDSEVDKRLARIGGERAEDLKSKAAIANTRLAYQTYEQVVAEPRWQRLADAGGAPQRPLWASTSVKSDALPDTLYVTELVAPGVVNTMPEKTIMAVADHGEITGDTVRAHYAEAQRTLEAVQDVGVDLDDVYRVLEDEGVQKFVDSWDALLASVSAKLEAAR
ncbi:MAG TPA: transaldolase [Jiangellaceae bacterium]|nr:transaldolase [Jiangellaceae bacterium]